MSSANKARGTRYETDIENWLNEYGYEAQRLPRSGALDQGDLEVRLRDRLRLVIEAKNHKGLSLADWLKQAEVEADNRENKTGVPSVPVVFAKRRGKGVQHSYVVMDSTEFIQLLRLAGIQAKTHAEDAAVN